MATPPRYFQKDAYYHVFNRGIRKQDIFIQNRDYVRFLDRLKEYKEMYEVSILVYCLMPNHFHFLLKQETEIPITHFMLRLCTSYAKYFNIKYEQVGSLFQGPFKAKLVDSDEYLLQLSRYIHRNPLPTRGVELGSYQWSSYSNYISGAKNDLVDPSIIFDYFSKNNPSSDYRKFTEFDFKNEDDDQIRDLIIEN